MFNEARDGQLHMVQYTRIVLSQLASLVATRSPTNRKCAECTRKLMFRLRRWLCEYAWDLAVERTGGGWTISLKCFKVIGWIHIAWGLIWHGDLDGIRSLLDRRELSLHDQDMLGQGLVGVSTTKVKYISVTYAVRRNLGCSRGRPNEYC